MSESPSQVVRRIASLARLAPLASGRDLRDLGQQPLAQAHVLALPMLLQLRTADGPRLLVALINPDHFATQFERILGQFQVLAALDVSGVEEGASPIRPAEQRRADLPRPSLPVEQALANAPARVEDFYRVPKTVGGEE